MKQENNNWQLDKRTSECCNSNWQLDKQTYWGSRPYKAKIDQLYRKLQRKNDDIITNVYNCNRNDLHKWSGISNRTKNHYVKLICSMQ